MPPPRRPANLPVSETKRFRTGRLTQTRSVSLSAGQQAYLEDLALRAKVSVSRLVQDLLHLDDSQHLAEQALHAGLGETGTENRPFSLLPMHDEIYRRRAAEVGVPYSRYIQLLVEYDRRHAVLNRHFRVAKP